MWVRVNHHPEEVAMKRVTIHTAARTLAAALITVLLAGSALAGPRTRSRQKGPSARAEAATQKVVNLNSATEEQLRLLPGIGPSKARAILAYRARRKFTSTFQLVRVKGIGRKTYKKLRPHLRVRGETTLSEKLKLGGKGK